MTERPIPHWEDAWPHLLRHLPDALREAQGFLTDSQLPALIEQRFRAGDAIYRGEWMDHDPDWFVTEALEEAADLCTYLAMRRFMRAVQKEKRPPFDHLASDTLKPPTGETNWPNGGPFRLDSPGASFVTSPPGILDRERRDDDGAEAGGGHPGGSEGHQVLGGSPRPRRLRRGGSGAGV